MLEAAMLHDEAAAAPSPQPGNQSWPLPWVFVLMPIPYGVLWGYVQTPLPYLLRRAGFTVDRIGSIEAFILLPMALYFLWSPIVDFWLRRRTWILLLSAVSGAMLMAAVLLLDRHAQLAIWLLFAGFCVNLMTTACGGGLMAHSLNAQGRARAAAWMQCGTLGAQALGGAALLYLSQRLPLAATCAIAGAMTTLPAAIALTIPEPPPQTAKAELRKTFSTMAREVRETLFSWRSLPGLLLLISPVGTGAAQSLFAAMAKDYQVGEHGVVLLNGLLGAVLTMLGAFVAVIVPAHWDRRIAYGAAGLACATSGIFLALAPMRPLVYFAGVALYMLTTGACYAFFLGVVMVTMGEAGLSASSRYTILVSIGNLPIVYLSAVLSATVRAILFLRWSKRRGHRRQRLRVDLGSGQRLRNASSTASLLKSLDARKPRWLLWLEDLSKDKSRRAAAALRLPGTAMLT